jgi:hypothetical protein
MIKKISGSEKNKNCLCNPCLMKNPQIPHYYTRAITYKQIKMEILILDEWDYFEGEKGRVGYVSAEGEGLFKTILAQKYKRMFVVQMDKFWKLNLKDRDYFFIQHLPECKIIN